MIKMVTLDFDGTTADTMPTLEQIAVKLITKHYQLSTESAREKYRNTTGLPFEHQIHMIFPEQPQNESVIAQFEKEKIESIFELPLFDDAIQTIDFLREKGIWVAISSSTTQPIIEKYCQLKGLNVDAILGYKQGFEKGKDHFNFLIQKFSLTTDEMIYVGDSLKDCERAQKNEILFIGRIGMFSKERFAEISLSKIFIHELSELKEIVSKLNESK
ncbi:MAG: HAD family hydrolase [Candidatus Thorarchaeota archaeon]